MCTDAVRSGYRNPPCHRVISHLLNIVKVVLIEYHKNVSEAVSNAAATTAFAASLRRIYFPYRSSREYRTNITDESSKDVAKYIHRKMNTSMIHNATNNLRQRCDDYHPFYIESYVPLIFVTMGVSQVETMKLPSSASR